MGNVLPKACWSTQSFIGGHLDAAAVTAFIGSPNIDDKLTPPLDENKAVTFKLF